MLLVDSNIEFTRETFLAMRETLDRRPDIAMVTPHGRARHGLPCDFHYDTYATIYRDGTHFGPFTNLFPCTSTTHHVRHCHRADGEPPLQNMTRLIDLQSAFGGFVLVRPQAFREARWSVSCCPDGMPRSSKWAHDIEHWRFCDHIRSHGRIVMDTRASVTWWE